MGRFTKHRHEWSEAIRIYRKYLNRLLRSRKYYFSNYEDSPVPEKQGIYLIYHKGYSKKPNYIGVSTNLRRRLIGQHRRAQSCFGTHCTKNTGLRNMKKKAEYVQKNCFFRFMPYAPQRANQAKELELLEHFAIAVIRPKWMIIRHRRKRRTRKG